MTIPFPKQQGSIEMDYEYINNTGNPRYNVTDQDGKILHQATGNTPKAAYDAAAKWASDNDVEIAKPEEKPAPTKNTSGRPIPVSFSLVGGGRGALYSPLTRTTHYTTKSYDNSEEARKDAYQWAKENGFEIVTF